MPLARLQTLSLCARISISALCLLATAAKAELVKGIEFPQGAISFADEVADFTPVIKSGEPTAPNRDPTKALGKPNYVSEGPCTDVSACPFVSLGDGGSITLRFVDNRLTGSGSSAPDLWIFEVGPDVEDTLVEISADGFLWHSVGNVGGSVSGVNIDAFGFGTTSQFAYVRLTDDAALDDQTGPSVGADIDAVGAISTVPVPEPHTWALMCVGLYALMIGIRRRSRLASRSTSYSG